ncbi:unnamed protein product [Caenorhabditis auriculariae]|uniref:Uncharacterized protein n=1 Tax=Caenorhabditis auriculariae TaxID=2777116 RepID=A0A8S1GPU2_9PELO|nr:unnamed protein product [Caenorhabditis auriculariae]
MDIELLANGIARPDGINVPERRGRHPTGQRSSRILMFANMSISVTARFVNTTRDPSGFGSQTPLSSLVSYTIRGPVFGEEYTGGFVPPDFSDCCFFVSLRRTIRGNALVALQERVVSDRQCAHLSVFSAVIRNDSLGNGSSAVFISFFIRLQFMQISENKTKRLGEQLYEEWMDYKHLERRASDSTITTVESAPRGRHRLHQEYLARLSKTPPLPPTPQPVQPSPVKSETAKKARQL